MRFQSKKYFSFTIVSFVIYIVTAFSLQANAADVIQHIFTEQTAVGQGSNASFISTDASLNYVNKGNNSSIIQNYFTGQYYDSVAGTFVVNWSSDATKNVRIVASTSLCGGSEYGYKLGGFAYSETMGYIDFDYNSNIFVYYCNSDQSLHGYAYSNQIGYQSFEGISFPISSSSNIETQTPNSSSGQFVNSDSEIFDDIDDTIDNTNSEISEGDGYEFVTPGSNSYYNLNSPTPIIAPTINIGGVKLEFIPEEETIFYIIK